MSSKKKKLSKKGRQKRREANNAGVGRIELEKVHEIPEPVAEISSSLLERARKL